jgi:hypothetical protein
MFPEILASIEEQESNSHFYTSKIMLAKFSAKITSGVPKFQ